MFKPEKIIEFHRDLPVRRQSHLYSLPYCSIAITHMQRDLAATDTTPTFAGSNSGLDVYLAIVRRTLSDI